MADEVDYQELARLLEDPAAWSRADFTPPVPHWPTSRAPSRSPIRAMRSTSVAAEVADRLDAAIDTYVGSR
jgi:hypothetical protein